MTEEITILEWVIGGISIAYAGGYTYLMAQTSKISDDLGAHKTLVAGFYLPRTEFNDGMTLIRDDIKRVETAQKDGNKANLDSNERIRGEVSQGYNTLATMISNNNKASAEATVNTAAIIAAVNAKTQQ